jgi:hypothetical protein
MKQVNYRRNFRPFSQIGLPEAISVARLMVAAIRSQEDISACPIKSVP